MDAYSYEFYESLSLYLPMAFLLTSYLVIAIIACALIFCCYFSNNVWSAVFGILQLVYGGKLQKVQDEGRKRPRVSLYGLPLHQVIMILPLISIATVYYCAFVTFFAELFLTESVGVCNTAKCSWRELF